MACQLMFPGKRVLSASFTLFDSCRSTLEVIGETELSRIPKGRDCGLIGLLLWSKSVSLKEVEVFPVGLGKFTLTSTCCP